jgi:hypothetical protein
MQQHNINNTQRIITAMELNQNFPINSISIHGDFFTSSLLCSILLLNANVASHANPTDYNNTKEGAYIPFSLSKAKLSNLDLIILSTCTKSNKCLNYLRTRAYLLTVRYNVQVRFVMNVFIQMTAQQLSKVFQKHMCWHCPAVFLYPRAGSLDEVWMLLHHLTNQEYSCLFSPSTDFHSLTFFIVFDSSGVKLSFCCLTFMEVPVAFLDAIIVGRDPDIFIDNLFPSIFL